MSIDKDLVALQVMLDKQDELDEKIIEARDLNWDSSQDRLDDLCTAMSSEVEELRNETNWKWWKDSTLTIKKEAKEELIDILHFWLSAANVLGMDAEEIVESYLDKHEVNHERQDNGY